MSSRRPRAVTHSAWINAWTLQVACRALGVDLAVDVARRDLPLPRQPRDAAADWAMFTDERSLAAALAQPGAARHWPQHFPVALLDDKWAFAAWLAEDAGGPQGLPQWPLGTAAESLTWPVLLKARHSWRGERKLPRGEVCRSPAELTRALERLPSDERPWYFLQPWFGDGPMRLLSVAGFFDARSPQRHLAAVTNRLAHYGAGPSSSALLVTTDDSLGLVPLTERVLARLDYCGPYELEFVIVDDRVHVLELNPRFWMQHGLFLLVGNGLVRRYLGRDTAADHGQRLLPAGLLWADGFWLLRELARGRLGPWRRVLAARRAGRAVVCPTPAAALRALAWRMLGGR
jgi:hypothetical protein